MSRLVRLTDFQLYALPSELAGVEQRLINQSLFTTYEPVRLWLKEHHIKAPFRKVLVSLSEEAASAPWHGHVSNANGICEVTEAIDATTLVAKAADHRFMLGLVQHGLGCVERSTGWRSAELEGFIKVASESRLPLVHFFDRLAKIEKASGMKCVPWLSVRPGETQVGVRLGERDVTVVSKPGPLYLEDSFPLAKAVIRGREYVLLDKDGKLLASVGMDNVSPH